ncbi:MAG TPA: RNA methyltransferase [Acidimicrobiales bacterium]
MQKRSVRWDERAFVVEGAELLRTALDAGLAVESVYLSPEGNDDRDVQSACQKAIATGARHFALAPGVLERVADTVTPQPVLAVLPMLDHDVTTLTQPPSDSALLVVLVDVRDPGNAGTVLRTADASGASGVVFSADSVDPYNPKTVRSSAGSLFHVPFWTEHDALALTASLGQAGYRTLAATAKDGEDYAALDWCQPSAVFLGNEAAGLTPEVAAATSARLVIPMEGKAESLNVGVASAVVCFEALRQRRTA